MLAHTIQVGLLRGETTINRQLTFQSRHWISVIKSEAESVKYNRRRSWERAVEEKFEVWSPRTNKVKDEQRSQQTYFGTVFGHSSSRTCGKRGVLLLQKRVKSVEEAELEVYIIQVKGGQSKVQV